ncbi:DUF2283 domain-containing protein [Corynebacterium casei]|uniref:DUF2283 domain-containing protein n=1 Tax=Corynebacterium casei TaxID=160386 RepID=UPI003FD4C47F
MKIQVTQADDMTAAYIELNSRAVKQSVELTPDVIVDCDQFDCVVGIELLSLSRIPRPQDIENKVHVHTEDQKTLGVALSHLMRMSATSGSLTSRSQVQAAPVEGRELEAH